MSIVGHGTSRWRTGWRRRRAWASLLAWVFAPPLLVAGAFALQPTHLALDIPVQSNPVGYFWWEEQRAELAYADEWGVLYVHRQAGTAYPEQQGWRTADAAFAYFDGWLKAHGWKPGGSSSDSPTLPESRLLAAANVRVYHRDGGGLEFVRLAIWPVGGSVDGFHVVLVTERQSWLRRISKGLD
jgi:hypothetical protein